MEVEVVFNGTPAQFAAAICAFEQRLYNRREHTLASFSGDHDSDVDPAANVVRETFSVSSCSGLGYITATSLPGKRTMLLVHTLDEDWSTLRPAWELLRNELERQGWIERTQPMQEELAIAIDTETEDPTLTGVDDSERQQETKPWEDLANPDHREAVRLYCQEGFTATEVCKTLKNVAPKTLYNITSNLYKKYPNLRKQGPKRQRKN